MSLFPQPVPPERLNESNLDIDSSQCSQCGFRFYNRDKLRSHRLAVHKPCWPFKCGECYAHFSDGNSLTSHGHNEHLCVDRPFMCYHCSLCFPGFLPLWQHTGLVHFTTFLTLAQLDEQIRAKKKEEFEQVLEQAQQRNRMLYLAESDSSSNPEESSTSTSHQDRPKSSELEAATNTYCSLCSHYYTTPNRLKEHRLLIHESRGNFKCTFCPNTFRNRRSLSNHLTTHSNDRNCVCHLCRSRFKTESTLKVHLASFHKYRKK